MQKPLLLERQKSACANADEISYTDMSKIVNEEFYKCTYYNGGASLEASVIKNKPISRLTILTYLDVRMQNRKIHCRCNGTSL